MLPNAGGLVYGTILVATLLSAESPRRQTYPRTEAAVAVALILYWVTITYSEYAGERLEHEVPFSWAGFGHTAIREVTLLYGAAVPFVLILVFWAAGAALTTAVSVAIWVAAAAIVAAEVVIGVRAKLKGTELARQTGIGAVLGLLVVVLRVLLH